MNHWLTDFKSSFREDIFDFLWQQWSALGVFGAGNSNENRIIDPEALLLFSLSVCTQEPRLFDEIIDWLFQNGRFVNVQRLRQMQKQYNFSCDRQLSAVAEYLSGLSHYKLKWVGLAKKQSEGSTAPLFFSDDGKALPCPGENEADPIFLKHGLMRSKVNLRGYSATFDFRNSACMLLSLRALIGIHARAEILCMLAAGRETHPSEVSRQTSYYNKTVQDALIEMSCSGTVLIKKANKKKYYQLSPVALETMHKQCGCSPVWLNWPQLLKIVETVWQTLYSLDESEMDNVLLLSEIVKLLKAIEKKHPFSDIDEMFTEESISPDNYQGIFQNKLHRLSDRLKGSVIPG